MHTSCIGCSSLAAALSFAGSLPIWKQPAGTHTCTMPPGSVRRVPGGSAGEAGAGVGSTGVALGGVGVALGGSGVALGGMGVTLGGSGVALGGMGVALGGTGVALGGMGVTLGGTGVALGGSGVALGGTGVTLGGSGVALGGTGVLEGWSATACVATCVATRVALGGMGVALGGMGVALGSTGVLEGWNATTCVAARVALGGTDAAPTARVGADDAGTTGVGVVPRLKTTSHIPSNTRAAASTPPPTRTGRFKRIRRCERSALPLGAATAISWSVMESSSRGAPACRGKGTVPDKAVLKASANSPAEENRLSRFLASAISITRSMAGGKSERNLRGDGGGSLMCMCIMWNGVLPSKGTDPVSISNRIMPRA